jgi:hypothetical protein
MIHRNNTKLCLIIYQNSLASSQVNHVGSNNGSIFSTFREGKVPTFLSNSLIFYFLFHLFPPNFLYLFTFSLFICLKLPQRYNLKVENIYPSNNYCDKKIPTTITSLMPLALGSVSSMTVDNTPVEKKIHCSQLRQNDHRNSFSHIYQFSRMITEIAKC